MDQSETKPSAAIASVQERFVLEWGRMSSSWGINRTMAQIHALLLVSGDHLTMDQIIDRLHISRGNASMNLRDLCDWGVVHRYRLPGDRKDIYHADIGIVQMFARVVRERKRREIDPTVAALKECLVMVPAEDSEAATQLRTKLTSLVEIFDLLDRVFDYAIATDEKLDATMKDLKDSSTGVTQALSQADTPPAER